MRRNAHAHTEHTAIDALSSLTAHRQRRAREAGGKEENREDWEEEGEEQIRQALDLPFWSVVDLNSKNAHRDSLFIEIY